MNNKQRHISCCDACENDAVHHTCEACMQIDRDRVTELEAQVKELEAQLSNEKGFAGAVSEAAENNRFFVDEFNEIVDQFYPPTQEGEE